MKFIIVPKEIFDEVPEEAKKALGIDQPRMSVDGTEVLLHTEHYDTLFPPVMSIESDEENVVTYPFPVFEATSTEFNNLIASNEWSSNVEEYDI